MATVTKPMALDDTTKSIANSLYAAALKNISWADADDDILYEIMRRNNNGELSIVDDLGWREGDVREVTFANGETYKLIITDPGHYELVTPLPNGKTTCNFVVVMAECMNTAQRMNSSDTNAGSWKQSEMRRSIDIYVTRYLPPGIRSILKPMKVKTATEYNSSSVTTTEDTIALFAEKEVFGGTNTYSTAQEAAALTQLNYFKTSSNRIKTVNGSASAWWLRSPLSGSAANFCSVSYNGNASVNNASAANGVCAFGCI